MASAERHEAALAAQLQSAAAARLWGIGARGLGGLGFRVKGLGVDNNVPIHFGCNIIL